MVLKTHYLDFKLLKKMILDLRRFNEV